uniref:Uncharacterized protein n=1 Tax=Vitis vinifera TaxID=29760 RepID=A5BTX6_VITVI|nr:hypothetical protein VITISV_021276 [Vitis vinifera]
MLSSQGCEVGFHLEVPSFSLAVYDGHLQKEIHPTVQKGCGITSQQKGDFAALCNMLPLARSDWLAMAATSSFQLRIAHRLKHWIVDFLSFEMLIPPGEEFYPADVPPSPDISHPAPNAGWERRAFQLPRSDMSGSSNSAYLESFSLNIQCRSVLLKLPDISDRLFKIFCFRYLMSKSPNSPCNPPIIGFLSL